MNIDLFSFGPLRPLLLTDADILFTESCPLPMSESDLLQALIEKVEWQAETITVWGKKHLQPRLVAWYGDKGRSYTYSGLLMNPQPWTELLLLVKNTVEATVGETFNTVLLNYYRNGSDSMGLHSDNEPELGPQPVIASLSLGEARTFVLKHRTDAVKPLKLALGSGSLLVMRGQTQKNWKHGIEKKTGQVGPRVNLTFRQIQNQLNAPSLSAK